MKTSFVVFLKQPSVSRLLNFFLLSILFFRVSLPEGFVTKISSSPLTVTANADSIVKNLGSSDAASLLALGKSWAQNVGIAESGMEWVVRLWTPGLPYLESIILRIFGLNAPIYLYLLFLTFALWITCFDLLFRFTQRIFGFFWAIIANVFLIKLRINLDRFICSFATADSSVQVFHLFLSPCSCCREPIWNRYHVSTRI